MNEWASPQLAFDKEGRIVVAYRTHVAGAQVALARFLRTGKMDPSFGNKGHAIVAYDVWSAPISLHIRPNQSIRVGMEYAAATSYNVHVGMLGFTKDGLPDSQFGNNGIVTPLAKQEDYSPNILWLESGKALVVSVNNGKLPTGEDTFSYLARFNEEGNLDTSFGQGTGIVRLPGKDSTPWINFHNPMVSVDGKQRIVVAHQRYPEAEFWRFDPNGNIDPTYGNKGVVKMVGCKGFEDLQGTRKGEVYATAFYCRRAPFNEAPRSAAVIRVTEEGQLDPMFESE